MTLGSDIMCLIFDIMCTILKFPVYVPGLIDLSNTSFKNQGIGNTGEILCFEDGVKTDTSVGKMTLSPVTSTSH